MLKLALQVGLKPNEYLDLTPRELQLMVEVHAENEKLKQADVITNAWLCAMWERSKKMPELKEVLKDLDDKPKKKTTELNYQKIERMARQRGLNVPPSFYAERGKYGK